MLSIIGSILGVVGKLAGFLMPYLAGKKAARADYAEESLKKSQENNEVRTDVKRMSASDVTKRLLDKWSRG
mgnify:FL=1|jgi:hypothetical protein